MPNIEIYQPDGKVSGKIDLPEFLFAAKINPSLMAQAVRVYLSNQRSAQASAKTRSEINRTTKKWYRQKGTGRARHGARSAPLFVGGGKAHGPTGQQNYHLNLPQKMRLAALASALTSKLQENKVKVVDGLEETQSKTKKAAVVWNTLEFNQKKITLVLPEKIDSLIRAFRNLSTTRLELANQLNTYVVLNSGTLVFTKNAIEKLTETFGKENKSGSAKLSKPKESEEKTEGRGVTAKKSLTKKIVSSTTRSKKPTTTKTKAIKTTKSDKK